MKKNGNQAAQRPLSVSRHTILVLTTKNLEIVAGGSFVDKSEVNNGACNPHPPK